MEPPGLGLSVGDESLRLSNESDSAKDFHNDSLNLSNKCSSFPSEAAR